MINRRSDHSRRLRGVLNSLLVCRRGNRASDHHNLRQAIHKLPRIASRESAFVLVVAPVESDGSAVGAQNLAAEGGICRVDVGTEGQSDGIEGPNDAPKGYLTFREVVCEESGGPAESRVVDFDDHRVGVDILSGDKLVCRGWHCRCTGSYESGEEDGRVHVCLGCCCGR
jgi:hypothetical protein